MIPLMIKRPNSKQDHPRCKYITYKILYKYITSSQCVLWSFSHSLLSQKHWLALAKIYTAAAACVIPHLSEGAAKINKK